MNYSKLACKLRAKIGQFSGYVSKDLDKTASRFVNEAIYGMIYSQSVLLTQIGRSLETDLSLKKIEERFCRQLKKEDMWEKIQTQILMDAGPRIKKDTLLIMDLSDLQKKYAKKMEYLARVRDGSDDGKFANGYWTNQIIGAELGKNEVLPLYQELYSHNSPDYKSENAQINQAIDMVSKHCNNRGIWVIDRGGDRGVIYEHLLKRNNKKRFIVRLKSNRSLINNGNKSGVLKLVYNCKTPYKETIVKQEKGKETVYNITFGYVPVKLVNQEDQLYMLVVHGFGEKPMMLLTTETLSRNRNVLYRIINSYIKRWSIEETIRFIKQTYDLENIRILKYVRLKNMMAILLSVFYFIAVMLDTAQKLKVMTGHILKQAKRVFGIPDFKYYALGDGLSSIFKRAPGKKLNTNPNFNNKNQLDFGFT